MKFPVVLHKDANSDYGVIVPDVQGCFSAGTTFKEALENVIDALALHFEGLVADGDPLPTAKDVDDYLNEPDYANGVWALVDFDVTPYLGKAVRFNAMLPKVLLTRIDDVVKKDHRYGSRSAFLASAAMRELAQA